MLQSGLLSEQSRDVELGLRDDEMEALLGPHTRWSSTHRVSENAGGNTAASEADVTDAPFIELDDAGESTIAPEPLPEQPEVPLPALYEAYAESDVQRLFSHLVDLYSRKRVALYLFFCLVSFAALLALCFFTPMQRRIFDVRLDDSYRIIVFLVALGLSSLRIFSARRQLLHISGVKPTPLQLQRLSEKWRACLQKRIRELMDPVVPHRDDNWQDVWQEAVKSVGRQATMRQVQLETQKLLEASYFRKRGSEHQHQYESPSSGNTKPTSGPHTFEYHPEEPERDVASAYAEMVADALSRRRDSAERILSEALTTVGRLLSGFYGNMQRTPVALTALFFCG